MFKNMKIGLKLGAGFGVVVALLLLVGGLSVYNQGSLNDSLQEIATDKWPKVALANNVKAAINTVARALRNALLTNDPGIQAEELARVAKAREEVT
ncbi:MAG: MCP four helix bundle domain-containing protein, partial [Thermodesulfobacteriota bacterium]